MKALLDGNVYDRFEADSESATLLNHLIESGKVTVLMPKVVQDELAQRSAGIPQWLRVSLITDGAFVPGISVVGTARVGGKEVFERHLGSSKKAGRDAVIAATANADADVFVSEDERCRQRAAAHIRCKCVSYDDFVKVLASL